MVGRRGGLSGKQKSTLLKKKRIETHEKQIRDESAGPGARLPEAEPGGSGTTVAPRRMTQQISKKGQTNELSTAFVREDNAVVAARRFAATAPMARGGMPLVACQSAEGALGLPKRPAWADHTAAQQAFEEQATFDAWVEDVHSKFDDSHLSPFEHNLEVWRQVGRLLSTTPEIPTRPPQGAATHRSRGGMAALPHAVRDPFLTQTPRVFL